jgi:hypothetical protein
MELNGSYHHDGITLESDPSRQGVKGHYRFTTASEDVNALWTALDFIDGFLNVLITGANLGFYSSFPKITDLKLDCENSQEVDKAGKRIPQYRRIGTDEGSQAISIDEPTLQSYLNSIEKVRATGQQYDQIATQFRAGVSASDEYAKFIGLCRAFNAFYEFLIPDPHLRDVEKIKRFPRQAFDEKTAVGIIAFYNKPNITGSGEMQFRLMTLGYVNVLEMLSKAGLTSEKGTIDYSAELTTALASGEPFEILASSLLCLYSLRNSVMHGMKYSYQEIDFLYLCSLLLQEVIINALNIHFIRKVAT